MFWDAVEQFGLGVLHLSVEELYAMTPRQYYNAMMGMLRFHNPEAAKKLEVVPNKAANQKHLAKIWNKIDRLRND